MLTRNEGALASPDEGVTPARFKGALSGQIRAAQREAWEVVHARPLTIRHKGCFKSVVTLRPAPRHALADHPAPDAISSMTGKDAGFVLRYFVGLVAVKLGAKIKGFCVPVDEQRRAEKRLAFKAEDLPNALLVSRGDRPPAED
jgi:hypothetical protein